MAELTELTPEQRASVMRALEAGDRDADAAGAPAPDLPVARPITHWRNSPAPTAVLWRDIGNAAPSGTTDEAKDAICSAGEPCIVAAPGGKWKELPHTGARSHGRGCGQRRRSLRNGMRAAGFDLARSFSCPMRTDRGARGIASGTSPAPTTATFQTMRRPTYTVIDPAAPPLRGGSGDAPGHPASDGLGGALDGRGDDQALADHRGPLVGRA